MGLGHETSNVSSGWRRTVTGRMREPVLAASVAGPAGQRGPRAEQADRDAVRAIAPVDEQGEHLAAAQDAGRSRAGCARR